MTKMARFICPMAAWLARAACACACMFQLSCAFGDEDAVRSLFEENEDPLFVAAGMDIMGNYAIHSSTNGTVWTGNLIRIDESGTLRFAMYGGGLLLASGYSGMAGLTPNYYVSPDGLIWGRGGTGGVATGSSPYNLYDGIYASGRYVVVGNNFDGEAMAYTSADGIAWGNSNLDNRFAGTLYGIAYGNGVFVAVGWHGAGCLVVSSADGLAWSGSLRQFSPMTLYDVAYGNGRFVAVGSGGKVTVSADGFNWSGDHIIGTDMADLQGVVFGGDRFVAVGTVAGAGFAVAYLSYDGLVWSRNVNATSGPGCDLQDVTYCHGYFIAVTGCGGVAYSRDGLSWDTRGVPDSSGLYGIACRP